MTLNKKIATLASVILMANATAADNGSYVLTDSWVNDLARGTFLWSEPPEVYDSSVCTQTRCSVAICHYETKNPCVNPSLTSTRVYVDNGATLHDAWLAFTKKNGTSGPWSARTNVTTYQEGMCWGFMIWQGTNDVNYTGRPLAHTYCGGGNQETSVQCNANVSDIDHGSVSPSSVNGHRGYGEINIECTGDTTIRLGIPYNAISLGGGIQSTLLYNNTNIADTLILSAKSGVNTYPIMSLLNTQNGAPSPGTYGGTTVVIIENE